MKNKMEEIIVAMVSIILTSLQGKYYNETNEENYLKLNADGIYFLHEDGANFRGNFTVECSDVYLITAFSIVKLHREKDGTLVDKDNTRWVKK